MDKSQEPEKVRQEASEKYNRMLDLSLRITDDYNSARRLDVEQLRTLLIQISIVSFGAVGFSIPIIGSSSIIKSPVFFVSGLFILLVSALGGFWYSAISAENSILASYKGFEVNKKEVDEAISNQVFLMKNPDKYDEFIKKAEATVKGLKEKKEQGVNFKRDKVLYLLLTVLSIGIILIFISILPFGSPQQTMYGRNHHFTHFRENTFLTNSTCLKP